MLCTETLNKKAIPTQLSLAFTIYSLGGNGVEVGTGELVEVAVKVGVTVDVWVEVGVDVKSTTICGAERAKKYTAPAPMAINRMNKPIATGRLNDKVGMRGPWTEESVSLFGVAVVVIARPHTKQRVAFSLRRVPQVGHTFWDVVVLSAAIEFCFREFALGPKNYTISLVKVFSPIIFADSWRVCYSHHHAAA